MKYKVEIRNVGKVFFDRQSGESITALRNVNLGVREKEFFCILGPTGCGKTTLLRIIAGLEKPTQGSVYLDNLIVSSPGPDRGMVFQDYALFPWRTVRGNVEFGLEVRGIPKEKRDVIVREYISLVGLTGFEDKFPYELSGGMQQRVGIARTLANNPKVLLMDDPFGALDTRTRSIMQREILRIWETTRKTIIFVTHDIEEAVLLADRIAVFTARPGTIREIITIALQRPRNETDQTFTGIRNKIHGLIKEEAEKVFRSV